MALVLVRDEQRAQRSRLEHRSSFMVAACDRDRRSPPLPAPRRGFFTSRIPDVSPVKCLCQTRRWPRARDAAHAGARSARAVGC